MDQSGFSQGLHQQARQEMALLPRMLQSIEVLQLSLHELESFLTEAVQSNEALRLEGPDAQAERPVARRIDAEATDRHAAWLESQAAPEPGLVEHLEEQLGLLDLDPELLAWTRLVIRCLDPQGYLSLPDETLLTLAREEGLVGEETLGRAMAVVQRLEPRGIGGRNAIESLLLQLDPGDPDYGLSCRLLEEFLDEVARNKMPAVAKALGVDLGHLSRLLEGLRGLDPAPGTALSGGASPPVHPELVVERTEDGGFTVRLDGSVLPTVSIDPDVRDLARDTGQGPEVRRYLRERLEKARWIVDAVEQRKRTLLDIATAVFEAQRAFLQEGSGHLAPLQMATVAERLEVHPSTVSRAVAGKFVETPHGVFPLRHFFQAAAGGSEQHAREGAREAVRTAVAAEDPDHPLSDDEIVRRLTEQGWKLARRTVAKYRQELGLPSSYRRRRYAG